MILKKASFKFTEINPFAKANEGGDKMMRTAGGRVIIEPGSEKENIVLAEIKKHPNALFFRAKAIEADCPNTNGDYFSWEELLGSYKSFEGVPFFTNHDNQNVENARGKVIFAEAVPEEKAIYTICFIDRDAYPHICRSIEEEYVTGVSMGCSVEYSCCNICGNRAERTEDYCSHIRNRKGRKFSGKARNVKTGEEKQFKDETVFEYNHGLKFIELSAVVDPACPNCHIEGIIPNDNFLSRVASMENEFRMIKTAAIHKEASQEEIDQIEQCLETLEQIAVSLIQNRKQVEMEFSSDLVKIMSDLQTWLEELVGAGYGNVQGAEVPGTVGNMEGGGAAGAAGAADNVTLGMEPPVAGMQPPQGAPMPTPAASETAMAVGKVSGSPSKPSASSPNLPITAPVKPRTSEIEDSRSIQRISDVSCRIKSVPYDQRLADGKEFLRKALNICERINKTGDIDMAARRTISEKKAQKQKAIEVLSNSWEEKQSFFEYIKKVPSIQNNEHRLSVNKTGESFIIVAEDKGSSEKRVWTYEDLTEEERNEIIESPKDAAINLLDTFANNLNKQKEGVNKMIDISRKAGAITVQTTPDQVQEGQLERSDLYHARQKDDKHSTTQKQLEDLRTGEEDELTEAQLDEGIKHHPRLNETVDRVQEHQLGNYRENADLHMITQKQLDEKRVNSEPDTVTENQLKNTSAPWARSAKRNAAMFKSASEHMECVIKVIAESAIQTGCTPDEACSVSAGLVDSLENRYNLATSLIEDSKPREEIDYAKRVAFWQNKNLKVASAGNKDIANSIVDGLRTYAADQTINPDILIDALDIISEGQDGIDSVSQKIEEVLASATQEKTAKVNRKAELRAALQTKKAKSSREERDAERKQILASVEKKDNTNEIVNKEGLGKADTVIQTSFSEMGTTKNNPSFKKDVVAFAKGALASQNLRMASITNVTINGDTIQIAVQTDTEENEVNIDTGTGTTEIPIGGADMAPPADETVPEGDMSGEGLGNSWASSEKKMSKQSSKVSSKINRKAQSPMGGGMPGMDQGAQGAPEQGLPGAMPGGDPVQALTTDPAAGMDDTDIPTDGERQMPWTVCPECGSTDVDVTNEGGDIKGSCNACTAEYEALLKKTVEFKIIKPTKSVGEEGAESPDSPEAPEVPALPVAAQTNIGKGSIVRIANNQKAHGHVCPSCGAKHCKPAVEADGHTEFSCHACGTPVEKDFMVSASNPEVGVLRVQWDIFPDVENCESCKEEALKFASELRVAKMLKTASANSDSFPKSACMERLARKYGGDTVASFGPCKGKLMADCVCGELQRLGFRKIRHLNKMASISMEKDPWDECIEDQTKNEGHGLKEAEAICNCVKKRFASEMTDNVYVHAFAEDIEKDLEIGIKVEDLSTLNRMMEQQKVAKMEARQRKLAEADEADIGSALPPADFIEIEAEVENEIVEAGKDCKECAKCECDPCECPKDDKEEKDDDKEEKIEKESSQSNQTVLDSVVTENTEDNKQIALAMNGKRVRNTNKEVFKMASTPKLVNDIEGNVEAGVPRSKATIRNEGADNIDVPMAKPSIPRSNAQMGNESAENINPKIGLPEVAVDSSYMGHEKEIQGGYDHANKGKGMPEINNQMKGTVIAEVADSIATKLAKVAGVSKESILELLNKEAKKLQEVDSVEGDVEAGVPRSKATIGNEGADNIDVPMAKPSIPRGNAEMGNEGADNINPKADAPDVPVDSSYMGHKKEMQKDMPAINDEMLKQVQQKRQVQMDRIANARKNEAIQTAAWLASNKRIASDKETFDTVVQSLMGFETDQIQVVAGRMFPEKTVKTASAEKTVVTGHGIPAIVQESKPMGSDSDNLATRLASSFTIGNSKFDKELTIYGEK